MTAISSTVSINPAIAYELASTGPASGSVGLSDNFSGVAPLNDTSPNDGIISFLVGVTTGDRLTLKAGIYSLGANSSFNAAYNGLTFTGDTFLANEDYYAISDLIPTEDPIPRRPRAQQPGVNRFRQSRIGRNSPSTEVETEAG